MSAFILRETCKFDATRRYVDIFHKDEAPRASSSGDQTIHLPHAEAAALVWKMNPDFLPRWARLEYGYATPEERAEAEEFAKTHSQPRSASVLGLISTQG